MISFPDDAVPTRVRMILGPLGDGDSFSGRTYAGTDDPIAEPLLRLLEVPYLCGYG